MSIDDTLFEALEAGRLPVPFHHADHVRATRAYLLRMPVADVLARFPDAILRAATSVGVPQKYHATITWAYVLLIAERLAAAPADQSWDEFAAANPDVLDWNDPIVYRYYRRDTLASERARRVFVMPDRTASRPGDAGGESRRPGSPRSTSPA